MANDSQKPAGQHNLNDSKQGNELLAASAKMRKSLQILKEINNKANIIALNAAIEGARTRGRLDSFSIVAEQIHAQAIRSGELSEQLDQQVQKLQSIALRSTAVRYYELAEDLIDKLDRNLFERNCDVQAWATFGAVQKCAMEGKNLDAGASAEFFEGDTQRTASALLERLISTYVVYSDVFLLNRNGVVIAAGKNRELVGKDFRSADWFKAALAGSVHVSDMHLCPMIEKCAVNYTAPVMSEDGSVAGVLSTRFNWDYAQEMIDNGSYDPDVHAYVLNRDALVIAATDRIGVTRDTMDWMDAGRYSMKGYCGFTVECARNGVPMAVGYAKTKGYNAYRGKKWTALIEARLGNVDYEHLEKKVDVRSDDGGKSLKVNDDEEVLIESEKANNELQQTMMDINGLVSQINGTNNETNMLAINAAIQAGIAGTEGESFAVIAAEIGALAEKSMGFVESVNKTAKELQQAVANTVATRLSDAARDAIDKVDRNLFERYCDVQAWTTFQQFSDAIQNGVCGDEVFELLAKLHKIYEVYHEIMLLDSNGKVIATAIRRDLVGQNQSNRRWYQDAMSGKVAVTDVYESPSVNAPTVAFSAPILGPNGNPIGVLTTRFNCDFLNDILKAVIVDSRSKVYLLNMESVVIGSSDKQDVLVKSFSHLNAVKLLSQSKGGYITETDKQDGLEYSVGYARTTGYNTYSGKNWSVIIRRTSEITAEAEKPTNLKAA